MNRSGWKKWGCVCGALALAAMICLAGCSLFGGKAEIAAVSTASAGVSPDSAFTIKLPYDTDAAALRGKITTDPEVAYELTAQNDREFLLKPVNLLDAGSSFTITVAGKNGKPQVFSCQVQNILMVKSFFPMDNGEKLPIRSGIEFAFNTSDVSSADFEKAFSIDPPVVGGISYGDGKFVFYPEDSMAYGTRYTVTLNPPLSSAGGAELANAFRFSFTTISEAQQEAEWKFLLANNGRSLNTLTDETATVGVYIDDSIPPESRKVSVAVYRFDTARQYAAQMAENASHRDRKYGDTKIDTSKLSQYASFEAQLVTPVSDLQNFWVQNQILQFPEPLPEGWYAADLSMQVSDGATVTRQIFLQSSDLSIFFMTMGEELVAWINDASTGQPVEGAEFSCEGNYRASGTTGADGTLRIDKAVFEGLENEYDSANGIFTIKAGEHTYVDNRYFDSWNQGDVSYGYYAYLFSDRPIYRTTDTAKLWGFVRPRDPAVPMPKSVRITLSGTSIEQEVPVQGNGQFTAEIAFEDLAVDMWQSFDLWLDDERSLTGESVWIKDYVKPIYTAETQTDKPVYLTSNGAQAHVSLKVSTFDGTPASSFQADFQSWDSMIAPAPNVRYITDEQGVLNVPIVIDDARNTWRPQSYRYVFSNAGAESENFYEYGTVNVIHRDLMLTGEVKDGGKAVQVITNRIDISGIEKPADLWERDALKGAPANSAVRAEVHHVYYTKVIQGTYYDFINKETKDSYYYQEHNDVVNTFDFTTADGRYALTGLPQSDAENCYYVVLSAADSRGKRVEETIYLGAIFDRRQMSADGIHRYGLNKQADLSQIDLNSLNESDYYWLLSDLRSQFVDDEDVTFVLEDNDEPVTGFKGKLLYCVAQDGFGELKFSDSASFTLPYAEELLPNYVITGAYFDGKHIYALSNKSMKFNPSHRELAVEITPEKETYSPADQVNVIAKIKNKLTGQPAKDATVVLAAVDEAIFAMREQTPDLLESIYQDAFWPNIGKYTSYVQTEYGGPGEKGGGGGDGETRKDFADTALFETARTDATGTAKFSFKLPDNITSWRLTGLALTDDLQAGDGKKNIYATQPFFVQPIVNEQILVGDSFAVCLRSMGTAISDTDPVEYEVTIKGNGVNESQKASGAARAYTNVLFDGLAAGEYTVTVRGSCGEYGDAVELPFAVVSSGVEVSMVKTVNLKDGLSVTPLRYPVTAAVYDKAYKNYSRVLSDVSMWSGGARTDMRIAARYVAQLFKEEGARWYDETALADTLSDVNLYGVMNLLPYDAQDIELTVKAHLAMPELFDENHGEISGLSVADSDWFTGRKSAVYLARALAGDLLDADLTQMIESGASLDFVDKMYLATALAVSGDTAGARAAYDKLVKPNLKTREGISGEQAMYVSIFEQSLNVADWTASASMLASVLGTDEAGALTRYLVEKPSKYDPYLLEKMIYLGRFVPPAGAKAKFTYTVDGKTVTEELGRGMKYLTLSREQLANSSFRVDAGEVYADLYYVGAPEQKMDASRKKLGLTRKVEGVDGPIRQGSLVKITLTPDLAGLDLDIGDNWMVIDEYVPSGMRFERYGAVDDPERSYGHGWYLGSRQGQRLQFSVYGDPLDPIVYYARCAVPGEYVVESAYISSSSSDIWGCTERESVTIG
ncbi:MAG: alpha-2-macroglobulin family protein [Anaerotruncus rubiinfantis]|jgi:hypothetical protein